MEILWSHTDLQEQVKELHQTKEAGVTEPQAHVGHLSNSQFIDVGITKLTI